MRAWTLIIALVLSALFGGQGLAASLHGCDRGNVVPAAHAAHASHAMTHLEDKLSLPDNCCGGSGACPVGSCLATVDLPRPPVALLPAHGVDIHPSEPILVLTGLVLQPLHGPPRLFLS